MVSNKSSTEYNNNLQVSTVTYDLEQKVTVFNKIKQKYRVFFVQYTNEQFWYLLSE